MEEFKLPEETAIEEMAAFVTHHTDVDLEPGEVKDKYPNAVKALRRGLLTFDDDHNAAYTLREPVITADKNSVHLASVTFRTRITTEEQQRLSKSVDMKKDGMLYSHKLLAHIIGQPVNMLDKIDKLDVKVIEQVASLFL